MVAEPLDCMPLGEAHGKSKLACKGFIFFCFFCFFSTGKTRHFFFLPPLRMANVNCFGVFSMIKRKQTFSPLLHVTRLLGYTLEV
ncbi:Uncharacterized protein APZ42_018277 [Daphnia magna]|uniref:Uncharacterized protein n=1 Tax=Daphnia magna TaxID=35525 RepID=A0A162CHV9_9CRUS|nr:Uncharacterized protein APZ42_018277 [Daphnia magna]